MERSQRDVYNGDAIEYTDVYRNIFETQKWQWKLTILEFWIINEEKLFRKWLHEMSEKRDEQCSHQDLFHPGIITSKAVEHARKMIFTNNWLGFKKKLVKMSSSPYLFQGITTKKKKSWKRRYV